MTKNRHRMSSGGGGHRGEKGFRPSSEDSTGGAISGGGEETVEMVWEEARELSGSNVG